MNIEKKFDNGELNIVLTGRLDTTTAPDLEASVADIADVRTLIFDFTALEYISSAGLRVLLSCQKKMNMQGKMIIRNVNDSIKEVFDITGFIDILTIE